MPVAIAAGRKFAVVDKPDPRKVHKGLVPRTGGIIIVLATFVSLLSIFSTSREFIGYLFGALIIACFGIWDDVKILGYRIKFIGQVLAAMTFTLFSGTGVHFFGELFPGSFISLGMLSLPVTIFFIVAVINVVNLSDGLDALASGLVLLTLLIIALLGGIQDSTLAISIAMATAGALIGFMRFNIHPAEIFMGDTGSQFLGYSVGTCLLMITQDHSIYSPVLPLFILGTPVIDTLFVMFKRIQAGKSPFAADNNHLHHRLLRMGLSQEQSVIVIYILHFSLICCGMMVRYCNDYYVFLLYLFVILFCFFVRFVINESYIVRQSVVARISGFFRYINKEGNSFRYYLSLFSWKFFLIVFALFFVLNTYYCSPYFDKYEILILLLLLASIFTVLYRIVNFDYLYYYAMFFVILVLAVFAGQRGAYPAVDSNLFFALDLVFYSISFFYFTCLVLTPEKVPLTALDYILLGLVSFIMFLPVADVYLESLRDIVVKSVLLGLSLNLIYSRIQRNRKYICILLNIILAEAAILSII